MNASTRLLEEKIAHLEHHVTQQDKAMLEFAEELARLRRKLNRIEARLAGPAGETDERGGELPDERPPHY